MSDQELISAIEKICGDDFCEDLDMRHEELSGDLQIAHQKLSLVYRMTHSHDQSRGCFHVHADWRAEAERVAEAGKVA